MNPTHPKKIIAGFNETLETIINKFSEHSAKLLLSDFLDFWDAHHMDCLLANRYDPRELIEAITEMFRCLVIKATDQSVKELKDRIIVLYFLLCLFTKQPALFRRKIRLTCMDAVYFHKLCEKATLLYGHDDCRSAWNELLDREAIYISHERLVHGFSMLNNRWQSSQDPNAVSTSDQELDIDSISFISKIQSKIEDLNRASRQYEIIRQGAKLDQHVEANMEIPPMRSLDELTNRAKEILDQYATSLSN